jgi:hypothetical protein
MTHEKNVVISDELQNRMRKPHNPEVRVWKENVRRRAARRVKLTSDMLIDKHLMQQRAQGKRRRSLDYECPVRKSEWQYQIPAIDHGGP